MGRTVNVAVVGCTHGELDRIYELVKSHERRSGKRMDLLICCGDFESVRNHSDLKCKASPPQHRNMMTFHQYYSNEKKVPLLTLFIGGNHEASNYLAELPYGGWVADNIYYMGFASVVRFGGLRIAGLSGIYHRRDYPLGHFEHPPFTEDTKRSFYHVRTLEAFRLRQLRSPDDATNEPTIDIGLSHDWPNGVAYHGDREWLCRQKPRWRRDIDRGELGNPAAWQLIEHLRPRYWFSAHMHCPFTATIWHRETSDDSQSASAAAAVPSSSKTEFVALSKPSFDEFLKFMEIESPSLADDEELRLEYDADWLAVLRNTDHLLNLESTVTPLPSWHSDSEVLYDFSPTESEIEDVKKRFHGVLTVPKNFCRTAPLHHPRDRPENTPDTQYYLNQQTTDLCRRLGITDINRVFHDRWLQPSSACCMSSAEF